MRKKNICISLDDPALAAISDFSFCCKKTPGGPVQLSPLNPGTLQSPAVTLSPSPAPARSQRRALLGGLQPSSSMKLRPYSNLTTSPLQPEFQSRDPAPPSLQPDSILGPIPAPASLHRHSILIPSSFDSRSIPSQSQINSLRHPGSIPAQYLLNSRPHGRSMKAPSMLHPGAIPGKIHKEPPLRGQKLWVHSCFPRQKGAVMSAMEKKK